ncbi:unnamed protein product [Rangifer tarandus platyrhynchus]|uniref:Uncharacterized protein n=1 Tax=Rangifer tarandus platyrhynchus TaxID=3082113 RepID=A0ABN8ZEI6_RANTA|nr:unnamed protein product [Rangifer tarandus platyrhynchus]
MRQVGRRCPRDFHTSLSSLAGATEHEWVSLGSKPLGCRLGRKPPRLVPWVQPPMRLPTSRGQLREAVQGQPPPALELIKPREASAFLPDESTQIYSCAEQSRNISGRDVCRLPRSQLDGAMLAACDGTLALGNQTWGLPSSPSSLGQDKKNLAQG